MSRRSDIEALRETLNLHLTETQRAWLADFEELVTAEAEEQADRKFAEACEVVRKKGGAG